MFVPPEQRTEGPKRKRPTCNAGIHVVVKNGERVYESFCETHNVRWPTTHRGDQICHIGRAEMERE